MIYEVRCSQGGGYKWRGKGKDPVLVEVSDEHTEHRFYDPLQSEPELYLKFGRLQTSESAVLSFAARFGALGLGRAPTLTQIRSEVRAFRSAVDGWLEIASHLEDASLAEWQPQYNRWAPKVVEKIQEHVTPMIFRQPMRAVWYADGTIPAAWLQLWMAIGNQRPVQQCAMCPNLFEVQPRRRFPRLYCSNACKQRSHRESKR